LILLKPSIFLGFNKNIGVYAENYFEKPEEECLDYSLFYFEIKVKIEGEKIGYNNWINIYLKNDEYSISLNAEDGTIDNEKDELFKLDDFSWGDEDIFGCGVVYPPTTKSEKLPYIFFTQNGKEIG